VDDQFYVVNLQSKYGCPKVLDSLLWKFFTNHSIFFGLLMMVIGFLLAFGGFKFLLPSLYFAGFSVFFTFFLIVLQAYIFSET
jgi:protein-S-isoprenylcysteine O-methyltransferase Ste14